MVNIEQIKSEIQKFYWTEKVSEDEVNIRKKNYQQVFESKKSTEDLEIFESFLEDLRKLVDAEIKNTSVTYFPSYSFKVILNIESFGSYTVISEYHFYISVLSNLYTGFFVKVIIENMKINSKEKNIMYKPLIIASPIEPYLEEYETLDKMINRYYSKHQFISLRECFVDIEAKNITYTVNKIMLFHLIFADFKKEDYKIIHA